MCGGTVGTQVNTSQDNSFVAIERAAKVTVRELFVAYWLAHTRAVKRPAANGHKNRGGEARSATAGGAIIEARSFNGPPKRRVPE
jgi:hypothetical protein